MSNVQIVTLDRASDTAALEDYTSSYNMRGVTVELTVAVRPAALIRTVTASLPDGTPSSRLRCCGCGVCAVMHNMLYMLPTLCPMHAIVNMTEHCRLFAWRPLPTVRSL